MWCCAIRSRRAGRVVPMSPIPARAPTAVYVYAPPLGPRRRAVTARSSCTAAVPSPAGAPHSSAVGSGRPLPLGWLRRLAPAESAERVQRTAAAGGLQRSPISQYRSAAVAGSWDAPRGRAKMSSRNLTRARRFAQLRAKQRQALGSPSARVHADQRAAAEGGTAGREALRQPDGRARLAMHPRTAPDAEESRTAGGPPRLAALAAARRL